MEKFEFEVGENEAGIRLDKFLADKFLPIKPEITRSKILHLFEEKLFLIRKIKCSKRLRKKQN